MYDSLRANDINLYCNEIYNSLVHTVSTLYYKLYQYLVLAMIKWKK
jgi:hypothetical protein